MRDSMIKDNDNMKQYSEPKFPAQEAWKSMQKMLDNEMPVNNSRKKRFAFFWFAGFAVIFGVIYFYNIDNSGYKLLTNINTNANSNNGIDNKLANNKLGGKNKDLENAIIATSNELENTGNSVEKNKLTSFNKNNVFEKLTISTTTKHNSKLADNKDLFKNIQSFSDLRMLKINKGEINNTNQTPYAKNDNYFISEMYNLNSNSANNNAEEQNTSDAKIKSISNKTENKSVNNSIQVPKEHFNKNLEYGLQWNILLPETNSYLNYNAKSQPLSVIIPEFWVNKNISKRSAIGMQLNPYSQYTLQNNNVLSSNDYSVTIQQGSSGTPTTINYVQTRSLLKAMGTELTAKYTYKVNDKFSVGIGLGNTWLNAAVVNDKLLAKDDKFVHDSLYGVAKGFKEWDYLKSSFLVGRLEFLYQLKKLQIGVAFVKPLENIYTFSNSNNNPVNGRLVLRWKIK